MFHKYPQYWIIILPVYNDDDDDDRRPTFSLIKTIY